MPSNLSAHITAFLSALTAIIAGIHPGFTISPTVQAWAVAVGGIGALVVEVAHIHFKLTWMKAYHQLMMLDHSIAAQKSPATPLVSSATAGDPAPHEVAAPSPASTPGAATA